MSGEVLVSDPVDILDPPDSIEQAAQPISKPDLKRRKNEFEYLRQIDLQRRRKAELDSAIKPIYSMKETGEFDDEKILGLTKEWAEENGASEEFLLETLKFFDLCPQIIDEKFEPEQKAEIACALAELVADGDLDAEMLHNISFRILRKGPSDKPMDRVADYSEVAPVINIYDDLFAEINGTPINITHILKHEISHGLQLFGGISKNEVVSKQADEMIKQVEELKSRESYRTVNAIEIYLDTVGKDGVSAEEIERKRIWLKNEMIAEKIAAYLESSGDFDQFLSSIINVMPPKAAKKLISNKSALEKWRSENKIFFDELSREMSDKAGLKARIEENTREVREQIRFGGEDFDFDQFFDEGNYLSEPAQIDNSKSQRGGGNDEMLEATKALFSAFATEAESVTPVTELEN